MEVPNEKKEKIKKAVRMMAKQNLEQKAQP